MGRTPKWFRVFSALTAFAYSQEHCEAMTDAVMRALAEKGTAPAKPKGK